MVFAGKCGVQLEKRMQSAPSSSQESSLRHGWAPEWMSAMAAEERLVRYNMDEAPLMRAVLVQQVTYACPQQHVCPELLISLSFQMNKLIHLSCLGHFQLPLAFE